jgi:hypothetical protein
VDWGFPLGGGGHGEKGGATQALWGRALGFGEHGRPGCGAGLTSRRASSARGGARSEIESRCAAVSHPLAYVTVKKENSSG